MVSFGLRARIVLALLLTLLGPLSAQASERSECPSYRGFAPIETLPIADLRLLQKQLDSAPEDCLEESFFLEQKVRVALALSDLSAALTWAERRVMTDPDSPAALMDYAWAARLTGQDFLAREVIAQLLLRPDLPPALRGQLNAWIDGPLAPQYRLVGGRSILGASLGYESNLNNRPKNSGVTLTFPTGDYVFELSPTEIAQAGAVVTGYAQWFSRLMRGLEQIGDVRLTGQFRQPMVGGSAYTSQAAEVQVGLLTKPFSWGRLPAVPDRIWGSFAQFGYGGNSLLNSAMAGANWIWSHGAKESFYRISLPGFSCASSPGLWAEGRRYDSNPENDSSILGGSYSFSCSDRHWRYAADVYSLRDRALGARLGGDTNRAGLTLSAQTVKSIDVSPNLSPGEFFAGGVNLLGYARLEKSRDRTGYSDLLDFGGRRVVSFDTLGVLASTSPPGSRTSWMARFERRMQKSNIELFQMESTVFGLGIEVRVD